jgi:anti-sigma factor RsiW
MNCAETEILICDYVDGALDADRRTEVERHLGQCPACAALAQDSAAAVAFMQRAADVEPPPELVNRILFAAPWRGQHHSGIQRTGWRKWADAVMAPFFQPKFVMSMALTVLSLSVLASMARPLKPSDLEPAKVWAGLEDRAVRAWARTVKFYDNLKVVYQIQTTLHEWQQQDEELQRPAAKPDARPDVHELPVRSVPEKAR